MEAELDIMPAKSCLSIPYEIDDKPPKNVSITAEDLLDASNGFHFREWIESGRRCYRWSGARECIHLPIRIDRTVGSILTINIMRAFCEQPDIKVLVDGKSTPIVITEVEHGLLISAVIPSASGASLLIQIVSGAGQEGAYPGARSLGLAVYGISLEGAD